MAANLTASTSSASSATTITPKGSPSQPEQGRFASLSPSKPGGLVRRPSASRQGNIATGLARSEKRRSVVTGAGAVAEGVKSPGELTVFVDKLLSDLEGKFDLMSHDLLDRMNQMSDRIDQIENSIHDIISTDLEHDHQPLSGPSSQARSPQPGASPQVHVRTATGDQSGSTDSVGDLTREEAGQSGEGSLLLAEPPAGL